MPADQRLPRRRIEELREWVTMRLAGAEAEHSVWVKSGSVGAAAASAEYAALWADLLPVLDAYVGGRDRERWLVEIEPGVWLAPWRGDPGRTVVRHNAMRYAHRSSANRALAGARRWRALPHAAIYQELE